MIASRLRNFIFLKTKKTGGTSVEMALSPFCGPHDILTPIELEDEDRRSFGGEIAARNYADTETESRLRDAHASRDPAAWQTIMRSLQSRGAFFNHIPAKLAFARLDSEFVARAYKFTIIRHPYERAVSTAYYRCWRSGKPPECLAEELQKVIVSDDHADQGIYRIGGKIVVDEILRQEHFERDLRRVFLRLNLPPPREFPRAKAHIRTDRRPAREILSDRQKEILYKRFRLTFDLGYEP